MSQWQKFSVKNEVADFGNRQLVVGQSIEAGLGSLELRKTAKTGLHMVRLSGSGHFKYVLPLPKDGTYRMGPNWGHRVKDPAEEKNPLLRVCRELEIPMSNVTIVKGKTLDGVKVTVGGTLCQHSTRDTDYWYALHTDGQAENVTEPETVGTHMNQYHVGCVCSTWTQVIRSGTWAIITLRKERYFAGVNKVYVAGEGCDPQTLRLALKGQGDPIKGAFRFAREAAEKEGRKLEWLAGQIRPGSDASHVIIGEKEYPLFLELGASVQAKGDNQYPASDTEIVQMFNKMGDESRLKVLPEAQRELAEALLDVKKGWAWLEKYGYDKYYKLPTFAWSTPERYEVWLAVESGELMRVSGHAPYYDSPWFRVIEAHRLNQNKKFCEYPAVSGGELLERAVPLGKPTECKREDRPSACLWKPVVSKNWLVEFWNI